MARPGFVHEVDERTPPLLVHSGGDFVTERFPLGTKVIYPADPVPTAGDPSDLIARALAAPVGSTPLAQRLRPGMRLTITFTDVSAPLPRMRRPDVRGQVIEQVLALAAAAGVDDVALVAATGLNRRLTDDELGWILDERVMRSFASAGDGPDAGLTCHDAENPQGLVTVGATESGREVQINRRVAESDLVVHVVAATTVSPAAHQFTQAGGWDSLLTGLGSAGTLAARFGYQLDDSSGHHGDQAKLAAELAGVVAEHVPVFTVEAALNNAVFGPTTALLGRREWDWGLRDRLGFVALRRALALAPHRSRERIFSRANAPYGVMSVAAGDPAQANQLTSAALLDQLRVPVTGQTDVLVTGVGQLSPFSVDSTPNPLVAAAMAAQAVARHTEEGPLVKPGGALIVYHPATPAPAGRLQPATPDFWTDVLGRTRDSATMADRFEPTFAADPWYRHLYRTSNAYHALQPFHLWYSLDALRLQVSDVIWVGADRSSVEQLGFRAASTLADALEMVSTQVGRTPSIGYLHAPPHPWVDVT